MSPSFAIIKSILVDGQTLKEEEFKPMLNELRKIFDEFKPFFNEDLFVLLNLDKNTSSPISLNDNVKKIMQFEKNLTPYEYKKKIFDQIKEIN
ncbi:MAG: hypothetical protein ACD_79C00520G0004 [uncultured bacterium]|nr:MAG: hypothetical protein ACD_79C00520G0004 [uncultured bacterium]